MLVLEYGDVGNLAAIVVDLVKEEEEDAPMYSQPRTAGAFASALASAPYFAQGQPQSENLLRVKSPLY